MREITDVKQVQAILLDILAHFKSVCEKHGLTFFLSNGSMLGAVKYNEFIPWDDDVDILMPREDYDKLVALSDVSTGHYQLLCRENTPEWRVPYAKLTDKRTRLVEDGFAFGVELGVCLDIFPLDRWRANARCACLQARIHNVLVRMTFGANAPHFKTEKRGWRRMLLRCIWLAGHVIGSKRLCRCLERRAKRSPKCPDGYVGCVVWSCYATKEVLPASVFAEAKMVRFCGEEYPVPVGYDTYLTSLYGDWRKELPPEKQKSNHNIRVWWKDE